MGMRGLGRSKAKAALAKGNTLITDTTGLTTRVTDLEDSNYKVPVTSRTSSVTANVANRYYLFDCTAGDCTLTLPLASAAYSSGLSVWYGVTKSDSSTNKVIISASGSDTIIGQATVEITNQYEVVNIISDGTNWYLKN